jgi:hypothetical protein
MAGTAELVCFGIQQGVQRLFYSPTHHLVKMIADPSFIDLDHLTHRLIVNHRLLLHYMKKPSVLKVRKILDVIVPTDNRTIYDQKTVISSYKRHIRQVLSRAITRIAAKKRFI